MTAGTAATQIDVPNAAHAVDSALPYKPRKLTRSERNRRELFVYHSPRNDRIVTITEAINLAIAMKFEFDPTIVAYVERPRRMALSPRQDIDISFWTRDRQGNERYYLAIPNAGTVGSTSGNVSIRDRDVLDNAAARHDLSLSYLTERELISAMAQCITSFELLPHVWAYGRLTSRSTIRAHVKAVFANSPRTSLAQLLQGLEFDLENIRAVVAAMVHDGTLRLVDYVPGSAHAMLEVVNA